MEYILTKTTSQQTSKLTKLYCKAQQFKLRFRDHQGYGNDDDNTDIFDNDNSGAIGILLTEHLSTASNEFFIKNTS